MSKVMLTIRRMPQKCNECQFCSEDERCYAARNSYNRPEKATFYEKPDWCPLQEISKYHYLANSELYNFLREISVMLGYCGMDPKKLDYVSDLRRILMEWEEYKKKEKLQSS